MAQQKRSFGKWIFIIVVILLLAFTSMIIAGILGLFFAVGSDIDSYESSDGDGNVALIKINGVILTETSSSLFGGSEGTSSSDIVKRLNKIKNDDSIKAVIFEVNSPGGSGVAADEISRAIEELNKTTVAYVRDMGTSAAYWIASSTDYIIVNRLSFVGSIGAIASYIEVSGLLEEYNITYQRFVAGDYKDFGSPYREPSLEEKALFQEQLDQVHDVFIQEVADNRNMTFEEVKKVAHGMFFTGLQAKELGLVDDFGGKQEAIEYVEQAENITASVVEYKKKVTFWSLLAGTQSNKGYSIGRGIGDSIIKSSTERNIMMG